MQLNTLPTPAAMPAWVITVSFYCFSLYLVININYWHCRLAKLATDDMLIGREPLPSNRQHLSYGDCLDGKRRDYLTSSVLLCIIIVHIICTPI